MAIYPLDAWYFDDQMACQTLTDHFHVASTDGLGQEDYDCGVIAAGSLLKYLQELQKTSLEHMTKLEPYSTSRYMVIDSSTRRIWS